MTRLIKAAQRGNQDAKVELFRRYKPLITACCNAVYIKGYEEKDLYQMAIIQFLKGLEKYEEKRCKSFGKYIKICIRNKFINEIKKAEKEYLDMSLEEAMEKNTRFLNQFLEEEEGVEEDYLKKEEIEIIVKTVTKLSEDKRTLIKKRYVEGKSINNYSKTEGITYYKAVKLEEEIIKEVKEEIEKE